MSRIIKLSRELSIPLELNMNGVKKGLMLGGARLSHYPSLDFWRLAAEMSATAIIGADAHVIGDMSSVECYDETVKIARDFGINLVEDIPLIKPKFE